MKYYLLLLLFTSLSYSQDSIFDTTSLDGFHKIGEDKDGTKYFYKVDSSNANYSDYTTWNIWYKVKFPSTKNKKDNGYTLTYLVIHCYDNTFDKLVYYNYTSKNILKSTVNIYETNQKISTDSKINEVSNYLCSLKL